MMKELMDKALEAVLTGMRIVRRAQIIPQRSGSASVKEGDLTIVTATDKLVEQKMHAVLQGIPGTRFVGEEGESSGDGDYTIMVDPIDGTRPFAIRMATSTVIVAVTDSTESVALVVVGDPATGRVWSASEKESAKLRYLDYETGVPTLPMPLTVWDGSLGGKKQAVVFTDHSLGFTRQGRQILTDRQVAKLLGLIPVQATLLMPGSNGMNFALVANGSEFMAGQITTAAGGPWDLAPVLLVLRAGGVARGFSIRDGRLVERDPRDITACDIMVSGNSCDTVDTLVVLLNLALAVKD